MISATSHSDRVVGRRGFTLIEILVVIGIIVVLLGILLPAVVHAYKSANATRASADIQAMSAGLEAYKADFGDYPRSLPATIQQGDGGFMMCLALIGPGNATDVNLGSTYDANTSYSPGTIVNDGSGVRYMAIANISQSSTVHVPLTTTASWMPIPNGLSDGADGPGFRTRADLTAKKWGPYLQLDRFKVIGGYIVDGSGMPYLYYPAALNKPDLTKQQSAVAPNINGGYAWSFTPGGGTPMPLYCSRSNIGMINLITFCCELGEYSGKGYINSSLGAETPIGNYPYLIIGAGPDSVFGPPTSAAALVTPTTSAQWSRNRVSMSASDDATNFVRP